MPKLAIYPLGEAALVCEAPVPANLAQQQHIWLLAKHLAAVPGVLELIPGMNNLTVLFDPLATDTTLLEAEITTQWSQPPVTATVGRLVEIPVHYGVDDGPDLGEVAQHNGLSEREVIVRHTGVDYTVFFIGFQPGFAYLGDLDPKLATPRRAEPRVAVPAGSVGIGGAQTGIYPLATPGGWQLIGRTDLTLFDPNAAQPTLLLPGDRVRFVEA
ncbi:MAG: 5-oxoprolinase subunit PxpB [Burkholderiales bacterium]|nr:5-oxoprolinase subunit PxpB [Burkholderiales bacterium]